MTYEGTLDLTPASSSVYIANGLTATGSGGTGNGVINVGNYSVLNFDDTQTIDKATITLGGANSQLYDYMTFAAHQANAAEFLTLGSALTLNHTGSSSVLGSSGFGNGRITNLGTINAESSGGKLYITSTFSNNGTLSVSNGDTVYLQSNWLNGGTIAVTVPGSRKAAPVRPAPASFWR